MAHVLQALQTNLFFASYIVEQTRQCLPLLAQYYRPFDILHGTSEHFDKIYSTTHMGARAGLILQLCVSNADMLHRLNMAIYALGDGRYQQSALVAM